jgi:hypothetical protein
MARNSWEDLFGVASDVTNISTAANTAFGIPLLNHPSFEPGTQTINQRKAVGTSYRRSGACLEYIQGASIPTTSFEFDVSPVNIGYFLWSLFQTGSFQGAGTVYPKYFVPYENATTEMWLTLVRKLAADGTAASHRIVGAIVKSITLSAEEGQPLKATVEFQGYSFESNRDTTDDTFTFGTASCYLWQNAVVTLDGTTVNIPGFNLTITNNALTKFYDNSTAVRHDVGEFTATGSFRMPYSQATEGANQQVDDFIAGSASRLVIYWGNGEIADADTELSIIAHIYRTGVTMSGDDEIVSEVSFECASEDYSSAVTTATASSIAVSTTAVTGTNTVFSNFSAGDLLYPIGLAAAGDNTVRVITAIGSNTAATVFPAFSGSDSGKLYKVISTPLTITLGDSQSFTGM